MKLTQSFVVLLACCTSGISVAQERIVSAGSAVTELMLALGAEKQLVAVDVTSEVPDSLSLPTIGYHRRLAAEGLLALNPTQLIGSDEMGPETALQQLRSAGIQVNIINSEATAQGLLNRIDHIAQLTKTDDVTTQHLKETVQQQITALQAKQPTTAKKVLFLLLHEGRAANVAGSNTVPDTIIRLAGAQNPAEMIVSYKPLSMESMIEMQPDMVLVSGRSLEKLGGTEAVLKAVPMLAATPAGKNKNIVAIDGHALVGGLGLKSLQEAKRIQDLLYP
ncbi:hemin ABC transporter substrate-binding protein [Vibrio metoecus]|uniref:heme/hemin ABC transporter substrate-binding protein n=1 Tax=Vibrio TaxID=662 RepID=UPI0001B9984F|nr:MULTISPECIES: ABC transporter substrate-binding protein [Vibrio]EEX64700.1 periplasmic hemin-binding protein [Vibrio metoecus]KQB04604.1 hemin ABC transporter substrate-binding protein [Vibrio metoecus]KQB04836.1 hemin ABC transporter substrate-binding protein [Vibrio metoecus]MDP4494235.1 ABC transporter substrate-binding protein [Vibrio sp. AH4]PAR41543.1 hemin ABC transporter substrate-binding protein [Vibrio metoecus]